jgi:excinuclease ABC subunit C
MVTAAHSVEWIEVRNELEALMLEYSLIKQHRPRFNVRLMDDKSYPFLAITIDEQWPRAVVMRGTKRKGTRYFGPYAHAWAIRETLDLLLRTFPVRTCSQGKFNQHQKLGKPCLLFHIEKCSGPCVNEISPDQYAEHVQGLTAFLDGDNEKIVDALQKDMFTASENLEF